MQLIIDMVPNFTFVQHQYPPVLHICMESLETDIDCGEKHVVAFVVHVVLIIVMVMIVA